MIKETKEYILQSKVTPSNQLAILSEAVIDAPCEYVYAMTDNYALMSEWDQNFLEGRKIIDITEDTFINQVRTKKIATLKGRDQVMVSTKRIIPASQSATGKKTCIFTQ